MKKLTPAELKTWREALGLSTEWLAQRTGVSVRTVQHWESPKGSVPDDVSELMNDILWFCKEMADLELKRASNVLLRFKTNEEFHKNIPSFDFLTYKAHAAILFLAQMQNPDLVIEYFPDKDLKKNTSVK